MNSINPLVPIWGAYQAAEEALKISRRVVHFADRTTETLNALSGNEAETEKAVAFAQYKAGKNFLNRIKVLNQTDTLNSLLTQSAQEISDLFVLSLWATFERFVRYFLQEKGEKIREILPTDLREFYYRHVYHPMFKFFVAVMSTTNGKQRIKPKTFTESAFSGSDALC